MDLWRRFNYNWVFRVDILLDFNARIFDGGYPYSYTGSCPNNTQTEYNALVWSDVRTKPSWPDVVALYDVWLPINTDQTATNETAQFLMDNFIQYKADQGAMISALAGKAAASHTHAQSEITGLIANLAAKIDGVGYEKNFVGTTDSSSRITLHLTDTGLSTGTALWNTVTPPTVIPNIKSGATITDPNQVMHIREELWSNGNKTVTFIVTKGTSTTVVLAATINSEAFVGAGIAVDFQVFGVK